MDDPADIRDRIATDRELRALPPYLVAGNRFGSYGFGAGLSGILLALARFGDVLAGVLLLAAVVLGATGLVRYAQGGATNRDTSAVGLVLGWVGLMIVLVEVTMALGLPLQDYYWPS